MSSNKAQKLFEDAMQANLVGDTTRAVDLLKQVIELDPERVEAWVEMSKIVTDYNERRMALTTILNLDPDNAYAQSELEAIEKEKPKAGPDINEEIVPGITRKQARTVGIGLAAYTVFICGITFFIITLINSGKASKANEIARLQADQAATQVAQTQSVIDVTSTAIEMANLGATETQFALATLLVENTATPTATPTRLFSLPPENTATPTPTEASFRVLDAPPALSGQILAWGGKDVRSDEYLPLRSYSASVPDGTFTLINRELGKNPLKSKDGSITAFEQWRADGPRLYMSNLDTVTPGGTLDALVSNQFLISALRDPSISDDMKRVAFIATDFNTNTERAYLADLTNAAFPKFHLLSQDTAVYSGITISPDGTKAVAVRNDGSTTDLVIFDLSVFIAPQPTQAAPIATPLDGATLPPPPTAVPISIPLRPVTTDGNTLVEANPAFSADGTRVVYEAFSTSTPNNRDLYIVDVGAATSVPTPIMTLDGNDVSPSFSPDGNYVTFASDRETGVYNIYIYDITNRTTYQLSEDANPVYPGSWAN